MHHTQEAAIAEAMHEVHIAVITLLARINNSQLFPWADIAKFRAAASRQRKIPRTH